jgi:hypothetical protein
MNVSDLGPCVGHKNPTRGYIVFTSLNFDPIVHPILEQQHKLITLSGFSELK